MTGDKNWPRYNEDVITPTDLPRRGGAAMLITQSLIDGMRRPIPAPAKTAKNIVMINEFAMESPKNPMDNNANALPPKPEK